jgi:hypothetical protein
MEESSVEEDYEWYDPLGFAVDESESGSGSENESEVEGASGLDA